MTYASFAKSWAKVAAVGGDVAPPSLSAAGGGAPASASVVAGISANVSSSNNGAAAPPVSNGGWGVPDVTVSGEAGIAPEQPLPGSGGGQGSSRPPPVPGKVGLMVRVGEEGGWFDFSNAT